jgi:zinc transporter ZupT
MERGASDKNLKQAAIKIVADMRVISTKVQEILRQPQCGSQRDALDDELSELHMLLGVLRRHIRGAEPMTKQQFDAVAERTKVVETVISKLEGTLQLPGVSVQAMDGALSKVEDELSRIILANIDTVHKFRRWQPSPPRLGRKSERMPWSLVVGVSIDCLVDGLLVGLTFTASHRAGYIMALATSIESCFLGLSLSSMLSNATASRARHLLVSAIPVAALLAGGLAAGLVGGTLDKGGPPFLGFIMFAIVSLLFLVTQELLLTAHAITDERALWYININLFLGAGMVIFIEKLIPA